MMGPSVESLEAERLEIARLTATLPESLWREATACTLRDRVGDLTERMRLRAEFEFESAWREFCDGRSRFDAERLAFRLVRNQVDAIAKGN